MKQLETYGLSLGIAFQIQDDILDIVGEYQHGRQNAGDRTLKRGKMTLPMIHFLHCSVRASRAAAIVAGQPGWRQGGTHRNLILPSKSIQTRATRARELVERLCMAIGDLPDSEAKRVLDVMAEFVVSRPSDPHPEAQYVPCAVEGSSWDFRAVSTTEKNRREPSIPRPDFVLINQPGRGRPGSPQK